MIKSAAEKQGNHHLELYSVIIADSIAVHTFFVSLQYLDN